MSGGSQHNPNGRQSQLGAGWSPLQVANFLARAPQAHMAPERGVTWHTPTPPPHLYHVPAPSPPDPLQGLLQLQAMKASGNSVFRHTATPPELYRHTPTPPDKHLLRHTPSPGDVKASAALPPAELYPHLGPGRDKLVRPEELLAYARGVDLSRGARGANGSGPQPHQPHQPHPPHQPHQPPPHQPHQPPPHHHPPHVSHPNHPSPALSVRDAPTINSLIARAQPRPGHARVDALLERLASPASPHSVIVHSRAAPTPSPPDSNEDSADSCGAPPGSKRKRKPERTVRLSPAPRPAVAPPAAVRENGDTSHTHENGSDDDPIELKPEPQPQIPQRPPSPPSPPAPEPHTKRKTRSNSAETIDDIAAMIASEPTPTVVEKPPEREAEPTVTIDKLKSVLASPDPAAERAASPIEPEEKDEPPEAVVEAAAAPKRRSARTSNSESTNVPVESPSEAKPAESEASEASEARTAEPTAASFVEVENQLEKMFAGIEEEAPTESKQNDDTPKPKKRRKSAPTKSEAKAGRRANRAQTSDGRRKGGKKKANNKAKKAKEVVKDAYDSGSNASSSRSRGPYIQIRGPRDSPLSVSVINAATGEEEGETSNRRKPTPGADEFRNGLRARGLHASTLGLRYDATTPDATWLCAFCQRGPHAAGLGDLFGPYKADTDCDEYRALDEATRRRYESTEVWFHEACAVWAPGLVAAGARVWGLPSAIWGARGARCVACGRAGSQIACDSRACRARVHLPCAISQNWKLQEDEFRATCPRHA